MLRRLVAALVKEALARLHASGALPAPVAVEPEVADPKNPAHGDFALNVAMVAAKGLGMNPRALADLLAAELRARPEFANVEVAGPGFINLRLAPAFPAALLRDVLDAESFARAIPAQNPKRINVEFVSVNPNGPITIGSGRGAAYGSALCNVLEAAGHEVWREYYVNDGINSEQMRLFAESVRSILKDQSVPENGYRGDYVQEAAARYAATVGEAYAIEAPVEDLQKGLTAQMIEIQREALRAFGTEFDAWFSEASLHDSGAVARDIQELSAKAVADEEPYRTINKMGRGGKIEETTREDQPNDEDDAAGSGNTLWLRSTRFGDDMDRVLRRKDGRLTYIASDVSYHKDKFNRPPGENGEGADKLITILGPDHHGYIARLRAVVAAMLMTPEMSDEEALRLATERLEVVIYQLVRFLKDGKPAPMRKRDGNIYALSDLLSEIGRLTKPDAPEEEQIASGKDVARFFYLMRSHDSTFDFDLDLAARQSDENPVFYVQYAHARICSVLAKAEAAGLVATAYDPAELSDPKEVALAMKVLDLPHEVARAAEDYGVHRLTTYSIELARTYHAFYDACRVIQPDKPTLSAARLDLCRAAAKALKESLALIGVDAPARMDRAA